MRAYRTFEVNLGPSVLFKNTLPMVETFLRENGAADVCETAEELYERLTALFAERE